MGKYKVHIRINCIARRVAYRDTCITPSLANPEGLPKHVADLNTRTTTTDTRTVNSLAQYEKASTRTAVRCARTLYLHHPSHTFDTGDSNFVRVGDRKLALFRRRASRAGCASDFPRLSDCPSLVRSSNFVLILSRGHDGDGNGSVCTRLLLLMPRAITPTIEGSESAAPRRPERPIACWRTITAQWSQEGAGEG